jgi:hypothetical protein
MLEIRVCMVIRLNALHPIISNHVLFDRKPYVFLLYLKKSVINIKIQNIID